MSRYRLRFGKAVHASLFQYLGQFGRDEDARKLHKRSVICQLTKFSFVIRGTEIVNVEDFIRGKGFFQLQRNIHYFIALHALGECEEQHYDRSVLNSMANFVLRFSKDEHAKPFRLCSEKMGRFPKAREIRRKAVVCQLTKLIFLVRETELDNLEEFLQSEDYFQLTRNTDYFITMFSPNEIAKTNADDEKAKTTTADIQHDSEENIEL